MLILAGHSPGTAPRAHAYTVAIHELMPARALAGEQALTEPLPAVSAIELAEFRTWLDAAFRAHPDPAVRVRYLKRWPAPPAFDSRAFKRLMGLNVDLPLNGFDRADGLPCTALKALQVGSGQSDTDWRNRERLAHDAAGRPLKLPDGRDVPADPLILNIGSVRGLASQAHAHYGLADLPLSSDPEVLRTEPWRFAIPAGWPAGPVRTFARESCQLHYDLGVLALLWGRPAGRSLGHLFLGHGMHFVQDVGNQIHTVQVGHYDLFKRARILAWKRALLTLGGFAGELKPWTRVGLELVTTHHVLSEGLNAKRIAEALAGKPVPPEVSEALASLSRDDLELSADFDRALASAPARAHRPARAATLTGCLIARSCREGGEVYRHMAGALHPRMSEYGVLVDTEEYDPDTALGDPADPAVQAHLTALYGLHRRAYLRVGTALRRLHACFARDARVAGGPERARRIESFAAALLAERLDALEGEEERLSRYLADPPRAGATTVREPVWLLVLLVPMLPMARYLRRRSARASSALLSAPASSRAP